MSEERALVRATQRIEAQEEREIRVFGDSVKPSAKKLPNAFWMASRTLMRLLCFGATSRLTSEQDNSKLCGSSPVDFSSVIFIIVS